MTKKTSKNNSENILENQKNEEIKQKDSKRKSSKENKQEKIIELYSKDKIFLFCIFRQ